MSGSSVWPILHYDDTRAALRYLVDVLGFQELVVVSDDDGDVMHAELGWPGGGLLVFGSTKQRRQRHTHPENRPTQGPKCHVAGRRAEALVEP